MLIFKPYIVVLLSVKNVKLTEQQQQLMFLSVPSGTCNCCWWDWLVREKKKIGKLYWRCEGRKQKKHNCRISVPGVNRSQRLHLNWGPTSAFMMRASGHKIRTIDCRWREDFLERGDSWGTQVPTLRGTHISSVRVEDWNSAMTTLPMPVTAAQLTTRS